MSQHSVTSQSVNMLQWNKAIQLPFSIEDLVTLNKTFFWIDKFSCAWCCISDSIIIVYKNHYKLYLNSLVQYFYHTILNNFIIIIATQYYNYTVIFVY